MPSLFEHAGGQAALHRLEDLFYASVLRDPLLQPLFGAGKPEHVDHLTAFTAESFGGPDRFSRELGFGHLIGVHRGLRIRSPRSSNSVSSSCTCRRSTLPGCPPTRRFGKPCASTSSSAPRSRCRTHTPRVTTNCTLCARFPAGRGPATTPTPDAVC